MSRRYRPADVLWIGGETRETIVITKEKPMGWDRSFTPGDVETAGQEGRRGREGDGICANADRSRDRLRQRWGQESNRQFLPTDTRASLPPQPCLGASSEVGQPGADGDSCSPRVCAAVAR